MKKQASTDGWKAWKAPVVVDQNQTRKKYTYICWDADNPQWQGLENTAFLKPVDVFPIPTQGNLEHKVEVDLNSYRLQQIDPTNVSNMSLFAV